MRPLKAIKRLPARIKNEIAWGEVLSEKEYDLKAMNQRAHDAIFVMGIAQREVAIRMGIDVSIPLHKRPQIKPTLYNIEKAAKIIGVSFRWLLDGTPTIEADYKVMEAVNSAKIPKTVRESADNQFRNATASAIVQGNEKSTIIIKNIHGQDITTQEREMLTAFRQLTAKKQAEVMAAIFNVSPDSPDAMPQELY